MFTLLPVEEVQGVMEAHNVRLSTPACYNLSPPTDCLRRKCRKHAQLSGYSQKR